MQNDAVCSLHLRLSIVLSGIQQMRWHVYDTKFLLVLGSTSSLYEFDALFFSGALNEIHVDFAALTATRSRHQKT